MKKVVASALLVPAMLLVLAAPRPADARPQYHKSFKEVYPKLEAEAEEMKCGVCHGGEKGAKKKILSGYGQALREALGEENKNVKDADEIAGGLKKIEAKDCGNGKTFGELLKEGKLPPPAEDE